MAQTLGQTPVGTIVKIPENGTPTDFIVVQQGNPNPSIYSTTFNNGTWLTRRYVQDSLAGQRSSTPFISWFGTTYKNRLDENIRNLILDVKRPYATGAQTRVILEEGIDAQIFCLSPNELKLSRQHIYSSGSGLSYWSGANSYGYLQSNPSQAVIYWIDGIYSANNDLGYGITRNASSTMPISKVDYRDPSRESYYVRPTFLLPQNLTLFDDGTISLGAVPVSSNSISISLIFMQGQPMNMTWQASPNADSYIVQRKSSADADWVQVQSGSGLSFSETVGSTWTTVQYRIAAVRDGNNSPWTETQVYNVVSTSSLLISGEDGSLGTIDSDVHYSVTSDTGNQITLTRLVNNVQVYTGQVSSGFTHDIPIVELPTGEGTIVINASVQTAGGLVSQTRTWTYTKTAMTFSTVGGISELDQNNQAVWPKTVMEAIRTYGFMGGTLDKTLMTLANAVIRDPDTGAFVDFEGQGIDAPQILVGSYVGTGGNTVTINTPFEPIAIFIWPNAMPPAQSGNSFSGSFISVRPSNLFGVLTNYSPDVNMEEYSIQWGSNSVTLSYAYDRWMFKARQMNYLVFGGQVTS